MPDSAHGTNPASASICGLEVVSVKSDANGELDWKDFIKKLDDRTAGLMLTNPNTLGIFERKVKRLADAMHQKDALLYTDGANFNALVGVAKPATWGVDVMHFNLYKTFSTPHGGGGPGAGPVGVSERLKPYLPGGCSENPLLGLSPQRIKGLTYSSPYPTPLPPTPASEEKGPLARPFQE